MILESGTSRWLLPSLVGWPTMAIFAIPVAEAALPWAGIIGHVHEGSGGQ